MDNKEPTLKDIVLQRFPYNVPSVTESYVKIFDYLGLKEEKAIDAFLKPSLSQFNHPFSMTDLEKAAEILIEYLDDNKKILFWGDYDCDGATTIALFISVLRMKGYTNLFWYVPHRHKDGYGINSERVKEMASDYDLIISGDTGIKELRTISEVKTPFIITDHHEPVVSTNKEDLLPYESFSRIIEKDGEFMAIPDCLAVVNPKRIDCDYNNQHLSGVAVIYKLLQGIFIKKNWDQMELIPYLDLVALGLVADLVQQIDVENQDLEVRMMTAVGLKMMNENPRLWVQTFQKNIGIEQMNHGDLGFKFGPRINAPGRLDSAEPSVHFLLEEEDEDLSMEYGLVLEESNTKRKELQARATDIAVEQLSKLPPAFYEHVVVVRMDPEFHSGIAGLVASSLSQRYNAPAIVLCEKEIDGKLHLSGSCRSIEGISILEILIQTEKKLGEYRYGGHAPAAGLTIKEEQFDLFRDIVIGIAQNLPAELYSEKMLYDIEVPISALDSSLIELVENSFHKIRFFSPDNKVYSPPRSLKRVHGVLNVKKDNRKSELICFNRADELLKDYIRTSGKSADIVYTASLYQGRPSFQLLNWKFL